MEYIISWATSNPLAAAIIAFMLITFIVGVILGQREKLSEEKEKIGGVQAREDAIFAADQRCEEKEKQVISFPPDFNGIPAAYHYEKVHVSSTVSFPLESYVGHPVTFQASDGIAYVILDGAVIGSIGSDRITSMVTDWFSWNHPVLACFTSADDENRKYAVDIVFYRDQFRYLLERNPDAKKYRLTGNKSEEMQDRLSDLKEGQPLTVEYDYEKEKYAVCDGWEIGYLPTSAARIVEDYGTDAISVYVAGTEIDDNWKTVVYIYLFE